MNKKTDMHKIPMHIRFICVYQYKNRFGTVSVLIFIIFLPS